MIGAYFLVNYVTQDPIDPNMGWAEGLIMVVFYVMIVVATWHYDGQFVIKTLNGERCDSVLAFIKESAEAATASVVVSGH